MFHDLKFKKKINSTNQIIYQTSDHLAVLVTTQCQPRSQRHLNNQQQVNSAKVGMQHDS